MILNDVNVRSLIQQYLFSHPMYNRCVGDLLCVCVVGNTDFAASFVDLALCTGQMLDKKLEIYWCVDESTRAEYLVKRPALKDFINIGKVSPVTDKEMYGSLFFCDEEDYLGDYSENCRYIFAATGDFDKNKEIAEIFKQAVREDCLAAYLKEGRIETSLTEATLAEDLSEAEIANSSITSAKELERMAFNTHFVWEGKGNLDYEKVKERFNSTYFHDASVSFVLSIPYKLYSVGISLENPEKMAEKLWKIVNKAKKKTRTGETEILRKLSLLEHRRWMLEKLTQGVKPFDFEGKSPDYSACLKRLSIKETDEEGRLVSHPCIIRSTQTSTLARGAFLKRENWDKASSFDGELDEFDLMSVQIHRVMHNAALNLRKNQGALKSKMSELEAICDTDISACRDYDRYCLCIENIMDRSLPYTTQFETYEKMLEKSLKNVSDASERKKAYELKAEIRKILFPVLENNMYRDYKQYDLNLVMAIPYILTAKRDIALCMPIGLAGFNRENNVDYFKSVASATALYAEKVTYLLTVENYPGLGNIQSKLKAIRNYFAYRGMDCKCSLEVFVRGDCNSGKLSYLKQLFDTACAEGYITEYSLHMYNTDADLADTVKAVVENTGADYYDGTMPLVESPVVSGKIASKIIRVMPYFEFESYNKKFVNCSGCEYLNYMEPSSFIQVEDMFALMNAQDKEFNYQDYADSYLKYWNIYSGDAINEDDFALCARSWTKVANVISAGSTEGLVVANQILDSTDHEEIRVAKEMFRALESEGFVRDVSFGTGFDARDKKEKTTVSLKIKNEKVRGIFTKAGDVLEIYVYFEACKTDWFDDVQTGFKFRWEFDDITNELDCVLTKDYRSILVECKSTKTPSENFFLTLDSLGDHFGIGYKKVLIVVTDVKNKMYGSYVSRGKQMDIIMLSTKEDLKNIGNRLKEIMLA